MIVNPGTMRGKMSLPALSNQTLLLDFNGYFPGTFTRSTNGWNPETYAISAIDVPRFPSGRSGLGLLVEGASTNVFLNSSNVSVPATQSISLTTANSGKWTCSVTGAGTVTSSAGTATATGYGAATAGSPNTITVTGAGTVTYTVSGANATTRVNVENNTVPSSFIETAGTSFTRGAETATFNPTGIITPASGTIMAWIYAQGPWRDTTSTTILFSSATTGGNNNRVSIYKVANTLYAATGDNSAVVATHSVVTTLSSGWHHLAITWDASGPFLWVDGVKQSGSPTGTNIPSAVGTQFFVGSSSTSTLQANTTIDQLRIFNRVLTASEIQTYYNRGR